MNKLKRMLIIALITFISVLAVMIIFQRKMLFYPGHSAESNGLAPWTVDGQLTGYSRKVEHPKSIWLFTHGNAGQAADRVYALPCFSNTDTVFILEYPGYGKRKGSPGRKTMDSAAKEAYLWLRATYPGTPVCVVGESIGSGPAASLATVQHPPDKIVLVVPFDNLVSVAQKHFPMLPARLVLFDRWDNLQALKGYAGKVEIYGAVDDQIIPIRHARALAGALPNAVLHEIPGGHNDWSQTGAVRIRN
jgi:uncharacterized protein